MVARPMAHCSAGIVHVAPIDLEIPSVRFDLVKSPLQQCWTMYTGGTSCSHGLARESKWTALGPPSIALHVILHTLHYGDAQSIKDYCLTPRWALA
ncbi:hypothetical protein J1614_007095 [Plenodomus biglobosus]|nr:hypothetical protein J1614_007095 [Plenodomus biglobosus]